MPWILCTPLWCEEVRWKPLLWSKRKLQHHYCSCWMRHWGFPFRLVPLYYTQNNIAEWHHIHLTSTVNLIWSDQLREIGAERRAMECLPLKRRGWNSRTDREKTLQQLEVTTCLNNSAAQSTQTHSHKLRQLRKKDMCLGSESTWPLKTLSGQFTI